MEVAMAAAPSPAHHDHSAHAGHGGMVGCDGQPLAHGGGTWMGHVLPGAFFCLWGAWWAYNMAAAWLLRTRGAPYRDYKSRAWYPLAVRGLWCIEPALKLAVPAAAVSVELLLDHGMQFQHLHCARGSKLAGAFDAGNMNNWQHAASYPGIVLAGLVDLLALVVPLPPGTGQAVLGVAWACMAFLMVLHEKHEPQDKMVHWLLFVAMAAATLLLFLDLALRRRSVLAGLGRAAAVVLQGAWLIQIGRIQYEGHPQWRTDPPYSGALGAMMAPAAFTTIALLVLAAVLALFCALAAGLRAGLLTPARLGLALGAPNPEADDDEAWPKHGGFAPALRQGLHPTHHHYDSARASDGSEDGDALLAAHAAHGGAPAGVSPFHIAHGGARGAVKASDLV